MVSLVSSLLGFDLRHFFQVKGETELCDDATSPCALAAESAVGAVGHPLDCTCVGVFPPLELRMGRRGPTPWTARL